MDIRKFLSLVVIVLMAGWLGACENTREGLEKDAEINSERAREGAQEAQDDAARAADRAADSARDATDAIGDATRRAGDEIAETAREAGDRTREEAREGASTIDAAQQTAQIKTALTADNSIDASHIDVDTDAAAMTVTLKGYVPTAAQKMAAERVAREKAPNYRIVNQLTVRG
jgi:hypothetical protein